MVKSVVKHEEEKLPIKPPLKVLKHKTINKQFGWWVAAALVESYAKKQICLYLWQKKDNEWKRKQKFAIHSQEDWELITDAVGGVIEELT